MKQMQVCGWAKSISHHFDNAGKPLFSGSGRVIPGSLNGGAKWISQPSTV